MGCRENRIPVVLAKKFRLTLIMPGSFNSCTLSSLQAVVELVASKIDKAKDAVLIIKREVDKEANSTVSSPSELRQRENSLNSLLIASQDEVFFTKILILSR
jgi:hypothetical protein